MPDTRRTKLIRALADIDQFLAEAEDIAENEDDECRKSAIDLLIEFQEAQKAVEATLRKNA